MIAPARRVAYRILLQIETSDAHSDELLRGPEADALSAQDRNLATTLVLGTLRWQIALDGEIRPLLARPGAKLSAEAATALRMGAYQMRHLERVPAHAAIHDSVELVKQSTERGAAGMVNAVLRRIQGTGHSARRSGTGGAGRVAEGISGRAGRPAERIAAALAHPAWMVERWARRYGLDAAEAICRWDQEPASATLRMCGAEAELGDVETEAGVFLTAARRVVRGDVGRSAAFRTGVIRVQDEASQLVAEIAAAARAEDDVHAARRLRVLDTCAAPGGKTAILRERLPEAEITAMDVSRKRVLTAEGTGRWSGGNAVGDVGTPRGSLRWEVADATKLKLKPEWDVILCDVPCSGTGTMARNPEIRLRMEEAELPRQRARQVAILRAALAGVAPQGRVVYATCSLEPEENEGVVDEVLREATGCRVVRAGGILDRLAERGVVTAGGRERLRGATEGNYLRTLPGVHPCDGFFAAVLARD